MMQVSVGFLISWFSKMLRFSMFFIKTNINNITFRKCCIASFKLGISKSQILVWFEKFWSVHTEPPLALFPHFKVHACMVTLTSPSLLQTYVQELFYSYWVPNETNALRNYTIYHRYPVSQEYKKMVDFISKLNLGHI